MLMRTLATIRLAENHPCRVAFTDAFIDGYNRERPHQGLGMKCRWTCMDAESVLRRAMAFANNRTTMHRNSLIRLILWAWLAALDDVRN